MKTISKLFILTLLVFSLPFSCKQGDGSVPDMGYNYFPDGVGTFVVYDVDSTHYDDFFIPTKITNYKFQVKEKIESIYMDNQDRPTMRLERYVKYYDSLVPYSSQSWILRDVWAENKTERTAEKVEENVRFVRLVFPVREKVSWNGNAQNSNDERIFNYEYIDQQVTVGSTIYPNVLETLYDDGGAILTNREFRTEKYARDIGMIYRREIVVESQPEPGASSAVLQTFFAIPIMNRVSSGFEYTMTINSFGIE